MSGVQPSFWRSFTMHLFFPLSRCRLEEFIAGVNMAVYEWHAHPNFRFLLISSPFRWVDWKIWSEDLIRDTEIRVTYVPPPSEVLSHCISHFSVPSCISLLSGSKAPIKEWVRYRYLSTYSLSEFLSHRSSLFSAFCLDGRKNWPRYRYLSDPPFRGQYSSFCPPLDRWEVLIIKRIGWDIDI